ncbi:MAG: DUF1415 domain-containing protein [Piscirickettsiaceae bacterium]|nr:DUF1415 domain-containing protein [Piscirickettsiaceae bacterium]
MTQIITAVENWLDTIVIGLNLCPFAAKPRRDNQIRFTVSNALTSEVLLADLQTELLLMADKPASEIETSLLIIPDMLNDFDDYNQFLELVDKLLVQFEWEGIFQVASFHPNYCFADTDVNSVENLTNRSPYPILHIIREHSLEMALKNMSSPDDVYKQNIQTMHNLSDQKIKALFSYLK